MKYFVIIMEGQINLLLKNLLTTNMWTTIIGFFKKTFSPLYVCVNNT